MFARARDNSFLHPVVRCYVEGRRAREHHVLEDLATEWSEPGHVGPLEWFVRQMLHVGEHGAGPLLRWGVAQPGLTKNEAVSAASYNVR